MVNYKQFLFLAFSLLEMACCYASSEISSGYYLKLLEPSEMGLVSSYNKLWAQEMMESGFIHPVEISSQVTLDGNLGEDYADSRYFFAIVSSSNAKFCGYLSFGITDRHAHLENLFLEKRHRGQGAGKLVLIELESIVQNRGIVVMSVSVMPHNEIAVKLYKKMGYQCIHSFDGNQVTGYYFVKSIAPHDPSNKLLQTEILEMYQKDQAERLKLMQVLNNKIPDEILKSVEKMDQSNNLRVKEIIQMYGWPGNALVGREGSHAFWVIVQHQDRDIELQLQCLKLLEIAVSKGEASSEELAYLTDRLRVNQGLTQVYGTQFKYEEGEFIHK